MVYTCIVCCKKDMATVNYARVKYAGKLNVLQSLKLAVCYHEFVYRAMSLGSVRPVV